MDEGRYCLTTELICLQCGEPFEPKNNRQIFCCSEHRYQYKKKPIYKSCAWCGNEFLVKEIGQLYCCPEHSEVAELENANRRMHQYRKRYTYVDRHGVTHRLYPCKTLGSNTGLGPHRAATHEEEERLVEREMRRVFGSK